MVTALRLRMNERLLWDIPEIFDTKDGGVANFKENNKSLESNSNFQY